MTTTKTAAQRLADGDLVSLEELFRESPNQSWPVFVEATLAAYRARRVSLRVWEGFCRKPGKRFIELAGEKFYFVKLID